MTSIANTIHVLADELSLRLRDFHRALILSEAGDDPSFRNPYTFLFAVIGDPRFAWTNKLAQLIVKLDEQVAEGEISSPEHLLPFSEAVSRMLGGAEGEDAEFRLRHLIALQKAPDVALATGALRKMLTRLPAVELAA